MSQLTKSKPAPSSNGTPKNSPLACISTTSRKLPTRMILHAFEKWGKTSFAAQAPSPIFVQSKGESGLEALMDSGLIGEVPHFPEANSWKGILATLDAIRDEEHKFRTLVIDTANGCSRQLEERTCQTNFEGNWTAYNDFGGKGANDCIEPWQREFLERLDQIRERRNMAIILLAHTKVKPFKNPAGSDFDRFEVDMPRVLWSVTHKWADLILFGDYLTFAEKEKGSQKAKGKGGEVRMLRTERTAAYDAGNRHGLPPTIDCSEGPEAAWKELVTLLKGAKS